MPLATTTILNMIALGRLVHAAVVVAP